MACKSTAVHCYIVEKHVLAKKLNRWCDIMVILSATYIPKKTYYWTWVHHLQACIYTPYIQDVYTTTMCKMRLHAMQFIHTQILCIGRCQVAYIPFHLCTPQYISLHLFLWDIGLLHSTHKWNHTDRVYGCLGLLDAVHLCSDSPQLRELGKPGAVWLQAVLEC